MSLNNFKIFFFLLIGFTTTTLLSQTYVRVGQNTTYNSDSDINVIFTKAANGSVDITANLKMLSFRDGDNNYYGYDLDGDGGETYSDIPNNWDFEIIDLCTSCSDLSNDKKTFTYSGANNNTLTTRIKVFDSSSGQTISNLSNVRLQFWVEDNFTVANATWNACIQKFVLSVNEATDGTGSPACAPYTIKIYNINDEASGPIYENTQTDNTWELELDVGQYQADIFNSCGEEIQDYLIDIREAYTFGSEVIFQGFQCFDDTTGLGVVKIQGARIFEGGDYDGSIKWELKDSSGTVIRNNSSPGSSIFRSATQSPHNPPFDYGNMNLTLEFPGLEAGTYTFVFEDFNGCTQIETIEVKKPLEILSELDTGSSKNALNCYGDSDGKLCFVASGGWTEPFVGNLINTPANGWGNPYVFKLTDQNGVQYSSGAVLDHYDANNNQDGYETCFSNLPAGTYTLNVTENVVINPYDDNIIYKCSKDFNETFTITEPDELVATGTTSNKNGFGISCNGAADGSINLSVSGGTANYSYAWTKDGDNTFSKTTQNISGLGPGTYNVTVTDANDCTDTASFTITEPVELTITDAGLDTAIDCYDGNGQIRINITGDSNGDGSNQNYTYTLTGTDYNGNAVSESVQTTALNYKFEPKAGTYTVKVTDANGCEKTSDEITLTQPNAPLALSGTEIDVSCDGAADGSINLSVSGGTTPYTFAWTKTGDNSYSATTEDLNNLAPGTYNVTVTDANDCTETISFTITEPDELVATGTTSNKNGFGISCNGAADGSINLSVSGGTANYSYAWTKDGDNTFSKTTQNISGLGPGTYNVTVTDANDCTDTASFTITEPVELTITDAGLDTAIDCYDGNGQIRINITGDSNGDGSNQNYTYTLTGTDYNGNAVSESVQTTALNYKFEPKAGTYTVKVTDANGCEKTSDEITLTQPENPLAISETISNVLCFGQSNGEIDITVTGGKVNYSYQWSKQGDSNYSATSQDITGLSSGTYTVVVTDANDCTVSKSFNVTQPDDLVINSVVSDNNGFEISCNGEKDASINLIIQGGTAPYTFSWTTNGGSVLDVDAEDQTNLGPGTYNVTVTDANNCTETAQYVIEEPDDLDDNENIPTTNTFQISCNGADDGAINITPSGGSGSYTFNWSSNVSNSGIVQGQEDQSNLKPGLYTLVLTDSNGCSSTFNYTLTEPNAITVSAELSDYNGFQISSQGAQDGEIDLTVTGGYLISGEDYTYTWSTTNGNGLNQGEQDQIGLSAGTYKVIIKDSNDCEEVREYTLNEPAELTLDLDLSVFGNFNIKCFGDDNGSIDLTITGGSGSYTIVWFTSDGGTGLVQGQEDQSGLGPGTYTVKVTDSNNVEVTKTVQITEPSLLDFDSTIPLFNGYAISCNGGNNGSIDISPTGGTGTYTYTWSTSNGSGLTVGAEDQSGLSVGTYTVVVKDENNCSVSQTFTLNSPTALNIITTKKNFNGFNVSCNGSSDGEIDITVSGGYLDPNTVYTYSWSTLDGSGLDPNSEDQTGLTAGTYTVVATDTNGCTITQDIEITQPNVLGITETISDYNGFQISEAGENDGSIDITVSGGTSNYSYQWSTLNGSGLSPNSEDQNSLTAGTYTVVVTDTNGCQITKSYTLTEPKELIIAIDHDAYKSDVLCYGDATASIKIDITQASVGPYTYAVNGTTYLNENYSQSFNSITSLTYTFTNLTAGNYTITITDANSVNKTTAIKEIRGPDNPLDLSGETTNITCNGAADGTIDITVTGGGGSSNQFTYFYSWTTQDGSGLDPTAQDQNGLGPGTYTVVVTDINDCSITESYTITQSPPLTYNLDSTKNITCNGDNDGEINITVTGGTGNYSYEWITSNGSGIQQGQQDQSGLGPGDYKLILRDGCNTFEYLYTITTPDTLNINLDDKVNILCHDDSTGKINITVTGGTAPYDYVWRDNFNNVYDRNVGNVFSDGDLSNVPAGIYDLTVNDANGCVATFSTELTQPNDLIIDIQKTDLNCYNSNNGTINVTPTGGVAPYSYTWSDNGNGNVRTGLRADTYIVTITDSNGCEEIRTVEIENAELFDVDPFVTPISCFGANDGSIEMNFVGGVSPINFKWNDDSTAGQNRYNLSPGTYSVLITDASGCEIQRDFTIIEPQELTIAGLITDAIDCDNPASGSIDLQISGGNPPYTFQWSNGATTEDVSGLLANNYSVIVTDSKGCIAEKEFIINRQADLEISLETNLYAVCETKEVYQKNIVSFSGGVAPYTIQWSSGIVSGNSNEIMDTKSEGSYQVRVTDALGCSESIIFEVSTPDIGSPEFSYDSFYLSTYGSLATNDPITFTNLSTEQYFNVFWDFGDGNTSEEISPTHTYTKRGVYEITLTVEFILGCSYSITKSIYIGDSYEIVIPNAFTPNNDGYNDTFRPIYYGFKYLKMQIFDTWGNLIYTEESTSNELIGWGGRIGNKDGENGNYFYQVSGNTHTEEKFSKNGAFTLIK